MSLPALRLYHARTNGGAVPEGAVVAGATPLFGIPHTARRWLGCALPSHPSPGVAPDPAVPCGKATGEPKRKALPIPLALQFGRSPPAIRSA